MSGVDRIVGREFGISGAFEGARAEDAQLCVLYGLVLLPPSRPDLDWGDDLADLLCDALLEELQSRAVRRDGDGPD